MFLLNLTENLKFLKHAVEEKKLKSTVHVTLHFKIAFIYKFLFPHNYSFYFCLQYVHRLQISLGQTTLSSLQFPPKNFHRHLKIFNVSFTSFHWSLILLRNMTDTVLNDGISCSGFWGSFRKFSLENEKKKKQKNVNQHKNGQIAWAIILCFQK